jgi:hypothetical protein
MSAVAHVRRVLHHKRFVYGSTEHGEAPAAIRLLETGMALQSVLKSAGCEHTAAANVHTLQVGRASELHTPSLPASGVQNYEHAKSSA